MAPGRSALLHWPLVAVLAILGLVVGAAAGYVRPPTFQASASLYVGKTLALNNTAAIPGLADAATQIAGDYARLINTSTVVQNTEQLLGRGDLGGTLTASQIPNSPQIVVHATASSSDTAVKLASAGSRALVNAVNQLNQSSTAQLNDLLTQYQKLESQISQLQQEQQSLQGQIASATGAGTPVTSLQTRLATVQTQLSTAQLQAGAVQNQYQTQYTPLQQEEQVIAPVGAASSQGSDRKRAIELGAIIGLVAGLVIGVAGASLIDLRADRRRVPDRTFRAPPE